MSAYPLREGAKPAPQALEAERAILGAALLDGAVVDRLAPLVREADFYALRHRRLWAAMVAMQAEGEEIDPVTLSGRLGDGIDDCGGLAYIMDHASHCPSTVAVERYAEQVRDAATRRRILALAASLEQGVADGQATGDLLRLAEAEAMAAGEVVAARLASPLPLLVEGSIDRAEEAQRNRGRPSGLPTGFADLDRRLSLRPGAVTILAARPGMGKSSLARQIAVHVARGGKRVVLFSLEMGQEEIADAMACTEGRVNGWRLRSGNLTGDEWIRLMESVDRLRAIPGLLIDDAGSLTIAELRSRAARHAREEPLALVVVDYLQLLAAGSAKADTREREVAHISRALKCMAKDLGVHVLALSQLNRALESRSDKRPMMSDLRESGAIEQDADVIMFIYREDAYDPKTARPGVAEILIRKQRHGEQGTVELAWSGDFTRFDDLSVREEWL